jgi:L-asparaginase II
MTHAFADAPIADVVRNGLAESHHRGIVSVVRGENEIACAGDTTATMFARSALKPFQLVGMLDAGLSQLNCTSAELAVMASSHSGQPSHVTLVREILAKIGLTEADLQNTPALPMDSKARQELRERGVVAKSSVFADCSGKHTAMLATCMISGWSTQNYLSADHPLQQKLKATVEQFTSDGVEHTAVDGCGAPLFSGTTVGLARGYARLLAAPQGSPAQLVASAMRAHPDLVAGHGRDVTAAMTSIPGLLVKDGAEGVFAAAYEVAAQAPVGVAIKVSDGASRPRPVALAAILDELGVPVNTPDWAQVKVLGGGRVVGEIQSSLMLMWKP